MLLPKDPHEELPAGVQWKLVDFNPELDGRDAKLVGVTPDGRRRVVVDDSPASSWRDYEQEGAVRCMHVGVHNLRRVPAEDAEAAA